MENFRDSQYEYILFDIPSLNEGSMGIRIASHLDGVILVVEAERVRREVAEQSKGLLERAQVRVLGTIFNKRRFYVPDWLYRAV